jgi:putative aminopeptidase
MIINNWVKELKHLTSIPALCGMEDRMVTEMVNRFQPLTDEIVVDLLGNVTATFKGKDEKEPTLLVFAHMDELGLMITKIEEDGFLRFDRIGGVPEKTLRGQFVEVHPTDGGNPITGFVGTHAHHLTPSEKKMEVPQTSQMYIDIGLDSKEKVLASGINIGSGVTYLPNFKEVGEHHVTCKSMDNRVGIILLLALAEHLSKNQPKGTVYLVASVQEEFSIRGIMPVFTRLEPTASICLEITSACDTPDLNLQYDICLGGGPAVLQMNFHGRGTLAGLIPHPNLRRFMEQTIKDLGIPFQRQTIIGEITEDAFMVTTGDYGVAMGHLSIPMRHSHSPIETCDKRDIEKGMQAIIEMVDRFDSSLNLERGI